MLLTISFIWKHAILALRLALEEGDLNGRNWKPKLGRRSANSALMPEINTNQSLCNKMNINFSMRSIGVTDKTDTKNSCGWPNHSAVVLPRVQYVFSHSILFLRYSLPSTNTVANSSLRVRRLPKNTRRSIRLGSRVESACLALLACFLLPFRPFMILMTDS